MRALIDCTATISDYTNRANVQNCELVGLADLDTGEPYVRDRIAAYLNDLLSLGVDGFRLDGSKHMPAADIAAIKAKLSRSAYLVQEVIYGAGEPIQPTEYTGNGDVHEFRYGKDLARMFNNERLAYLKNFGESWGYLSSSKAVVFTDNHDTQREGGVLTYRNRGTYALANAFMLAWPYGTPAVMSSFTYSGRDQGPPADGSNRITNVTCYSGWECEHRWPVIANMVGFRNATEGAGVSNWYDNGYQHIAFSRTGKGYLTINDEDTAVNGRSYQTGLPAGRYCDVVHGTFSNGSCSGPVITVDSSGWFAANVPAHDAIAIHIGAKLS